MFSESNHQNKLLNYRSDLVNHPVSQDNSNSYLNNQLTSGPKLLPSTTTKNNSGIYKALQEFGSISVQRDLSQCLLLTVMGVLGVNHEHQGGGSIPSTASVKTLSIALTETTGSCSLRNGKIDPNSYVSKAPR